MELSEKNFLMFGLAVLIAIATAFMPYAISHGIDGRMRMTFPKPHFSLAEMPPLRDKVALVTGAASGIGQVTAIELARAGAHVVIGVRASRCGSALQAIKGASGSNSVQCLPVDLASLASVADFANAFREEKLPLHILVLNAGVMAPEWGVTVDGVEQQFGVNHLGHFALTNFLVDILKSSAPARVVTVTSAAAFLPDVLSAVIGRAPPNYTDVLADAQPRYWRWEKYAESKLANILFTQELARRLAGTRVFCNSVHPGAVSTELTRHVASSWRGTAVLGWLPGWGALVAPPECQGGSGSHPNLIGTT